ncbi:MAG: protein kinase [Verrucomicrobiia bacterium]
MVTLLFTDIVSSTALKQQLGDKAGAALIQEQRALVRQLLRTCPGAEEIETAGDSFLLSFAKPSDAVRFALALQSRLRALNQGQPMPLTERIGIHLGEVVIEQHEAGHKAKDLYGIQIDTCARVMSLAKAGQVLLTRAVFDNARQVLKGDEIEGVGQLEWLNHGPYLLKGLDEPVEICEVREAGQEQAPGTPTGSEKAQRQVRADEEQVLGWRPAVGQLVPNTQWILEKKLGEGGFGEVWVGRHQTMKEQRVFKFCFRADRLRSLKREVTLFRLLKERTGEHPHIVRLYEVYFDQPPFYLEEEYVAGQDLRNWCEREGGVEQVPLEIRLEIVAQVADALQAAHDSGIIHRDVKPGNILVSDRKPEGKFPKVEVKLTDFGIGQVVSQEYLAGVTKAGFTVTLFGSESSSQTGTQLYMAPELLSGKPASTRSDIYSLGVVLLQLLVGDFTHPVTGDWVDDIQDALLRDDLKQCLAGAPGARFAGAAQLAANLRAWRQRTEEAARRRAEEAERDRLRRQAERRQRLSLASGAVAVVLMALAVALGYGMRQAQMEREQQRRQAYAADMNLAHQAFKMNNVGRARRLLDRHRPQPGQEDLRGWEWRYLWQVTRSSALATLTNRPTRGMSVAFSADGTRLAVGWLDGHVDLWDVRGRRRIRTLTDQEQPHHGEVAFSPVRNQLAATAESKVIRLYDLDSGQESVLWRAPEQGAWNIWDLSFSQDGSRVVIFAKSTRQQGTFAWIVNVNSLQIESRHSAPFGGALDPTSFLGAARLAPDNRRLYLARSDVFNGRYSIQCIDLATGKELWQTEPQRDLGVSTMAVSPDGRVLATGSGYESSTIRILEAETGRLLRPPFEGHTGWVGDLVFTRDGKHLISGASDQTIRFWDTSTWTQTRVLRGQNDEIYALAISETAQLIASAGKDGNLMLWRLDEKGVTDGYSRLWEDTSPDEILLLDHSRVLLVSPGGPPRLVDMKGDSAPVSLPGFGSSSNLWFWYSPGCWGTNFLCHWDGTNQILVREIRGAELIQRGVIKFDSGLRPAWADYNPTRQLLAWTDRAASNVVRVASVAGTSRPIQLSSDVFGLSLVNFTQDGNYLVAYAPRRSSGSLRAWNIDTGRIAASIDGQIQRAAYAGGRMLVVATVAPGYNNEIAFYDLAQPMRAPRRYSGRHVPRRMAVSFSGALVALGGEGGVVRLFNAAKGEWMSDLHGHLNMVNGLDFSADERRLISACGGREAVKIWDVATGQELLTLGGLGSVLECWFAGEDVILVGAPWQAWRAPSWADIAAAEAKEREAR